MNKFLVLTLALAALIGSGQAAATETVNPDLSVTNLERTLDMSSQLVKTNLRMTFHNAGKSAAKSVHVTVDPAFVGHVTHIAATVGKSDKVYLRVLPVSLKVASGAVMDAYKVDLKDAISSKGSLTLEVDMVMDQLLKMYPAELTQRESQLVLYTGNHYAYLPYKVKSQTTKVTLASSNVESYSKVKPYSQNDNTISYGPYANIEPLSVEEMTVHFENNRPFLEITHLERTIELSMWGNIAIEETVDVRHVGAKLKGSFSRLEYQRENSGVSSVKNFKTVLPASAHSVYYRDDIGNISTSALRVLDDSVEVDLRPRFPLFGGWKTHYILGYSVPSYEYLYNKGDNFVLNMRLLDHVFDDMLVDEFTLKIILPEGSEMPKLHTPYPVKREGDSLHFTYLDTKGRPVITIRNVGKMAEKHIQDFQLEFKFAKLSMLREPVLLIVAFFTFFALAILYVRLDFAITKDEGTENKLKVAGYCEKVSGHQEKRMGHYQAFENLLVSLKSSKDVAAFQNASKNVASDHKNETSAINDLSAVLKNLSPEVNDKIGELQKQDKIFREHQMTQSGLIEKLVTGKVGKQQFIDQDGIIVKKKDECLEKMNGILAHLRSM